MLPGTTWDYWEDNLTVPRLLALREEWRQHPPVHHLAALYLNYKPASKPPEENAPAGPRPKQDWSELLSMFPDGVVK